jgi:O-antigen ligase
MTTLFVFLAGFLWSTRFGVRKSLDYLKLFSLVALFSTIAGYFFSPRPFHTLGFYLGWCSNVNMNGVLTSVTSAYLLWLIYTYTANKRYRALLFALYAVNLVAVVGTGSRAAMLIVLLIVLGYLVGSGKTQAILIIPAAVGVLVVGMMTYEPLNDWIMGRFVTKFDQEALMTRRDPWQQSLEGAREGGLLGGGYGVSIGFASNWQGDRLSATDEGYGREKGNSQLAIIEETGLIGLLFYVILQCYIFYSLIRGTLHARDGTQRVALGIVTGLAFGLFVQSCFEGWYVAPGALESVLFWSTIGVGFGVVKQGPDTATSAFRPPKGRFTALRPYRIAT